MENKIKIGIIGSTPGNAHPYSWSAIINGSFDANEINKVGYPAVSDYLNANKDTLGIDDAEVRSIWTQNREISESIAKTTCIPHIAESLDEMVGLVDAVILSRDDPESHIAMSKPFIDANIPIFIDKPLAITLEDLEYYSSECAKGKFIMSCSSTRYANECRSVKQELHLLGKLELVTAIGKKDWIKYGIHLIEALFALLDDPKAISVKHVGKTDKEIVIIEFENGFFASFHLFMDIVPTFQLSLFGTNGWRSVEIKNSYSMFRDNIIEFIRSVQEGKARLSFNKTENIIKTLIAANTSFKESGKTIAL